MSELLRSQERVEEVNHGQRAENNHDGGFGMHGSPLLNAVAELHVGQRQREESYCDCDEDDVLHVVLLNLCF